MNSTLGSVVPLAMFITLSHTQLKLYKLFSVAAQHVYVFLKIMPNIQYVNTCFKFRLKSRQHI